MKFAIITHAVHKIKGNKFYAYEPYVREMNLWLKYVDEVQIVAPVSDEEITTIESKYQFQHNETKHHSEPACPAGRQGKAILSEKQITTSHTPRNDESERHSEQREAILSKERIDTSHTPRNDEKPIKLTEISSFDITSFKNGLSAIFVIPKVIWKIYKAMKWADHIHLRCPGNIGLLGCFVQILFPNKPKTIKYAGNWNPKSKQPLSYRIQKWILNNIFLTKNGKVLVYGEWANQSKNIVPFFTASYSEKEIEQEEKITSSHTPRNDETERHSEQSEAISSKEQIASLQTLRNDKKERHPELVSGSHPNALNFIFVGTLSKGKQPLLSVQVVHELKKREFKVQLNIYGDGVERANIEIYILENKLQQEVILHGNISKENIKEAYKKSHFLLFFSKSEGWPKVVAEAMFWGCLPISSNVSCIPFMLGNGRRGTVINSDIKTIIAVIEDYLKDDKKYRKQVKEAMKWSRQYTLERFEKEIGELFK